MEYRGRLGFFYCLNGFVPAFASFLKGFAPPDPAAAAVDGAAGAASEWLPLCSTWADSRLVSAET